MYDITKEYRMKVERGRFDYMQAIDGRPVAPSFFLFLNPVSYVLIVLTSNIYSAGPGRSACPSRITSG
jgi:hypothetical protein